MSIGEYARSDAKNLLIGFSAHGYNCRPILMYILVAFSRIKNGDMIFVLLAERRSGVYLITLACLQLKRFTHFSFLEKLSMKARFLFL